MTQQTLLAVEAAHRCRDALLQLRSSTYHDDWLIDHALDRCDEIERNFDRWPPTRLHRWLGFVFGVMAAREIMTPGEQGAMMQELLNAHPEFADQELECHRDPSDPFHLDIGGPG